MPYRNGKFVNWRHHFDFWVPEADTWEEEQQQSLCVASAMYAVMRRYPRVFREEDLVYSWEDFLQFAQDAKRGECSEVEINNALAEVWDYCDQELIWLHFWHYEPKKREQDGVLAEQREDG